MAAAGGRARGADTRGVPAQQRLHRAALLIALLFALPLGAQTTTDDDDIDFDPAITQQEFQTFSRLVGQAVFSSPVEPARARGIFGFDIGVVLVAVPVDDEALYWQHAVGNDFSTSGYVAVPKLTASKGFSFLTVSGTYSKVPDTDIAVWGGALDIPLMSGGLARPTIALRGSYAQLRGVDVFELDTYGLEAFISKGFGPITPYGAIGRMRVDSTGTIPQINRTLVSEEDINRFTVGVRISLLLPKIVIEATQAEERSYAAKVSFGL